MSERKLKTLLFIFVATNVATALCLSAHIRASYAQEDAWKEVNGEFVTNSGALQAAADFRAGGARFYEIPLPSVKTPATGVIGKSPTGLPIRYWKHDQLTQLDPSAAENFVQTYNARMQGLIAEREKEKWATYLKKLQSDRTNVKAAELAGPGMIDCGLIDVSVQGMALREKISEILALVDAKKPFRVRFYYSPLPMPNHRYGSPSINMSYAVAANSRGQVFMIHPHNTPMTGSDVNYSFESISGYRVVTCRLLSAE